MNKHIKRDAQNIIENLGDLSEQFSGKRILITGAAGFLGSHFIHYFLSLNDTGLLKKSCQVYALDNFIRGIPIWFEKVKNTLRFNSWRE